VSGCILPKTRRHAAAHRIYNRKSVTVITDDGQHWNVAPGLLTRAAAPAGAKPEARPNLVRLK
jgi:hypothetical protein